jgi:hypothetical protein
MNQGNGWSESLYKLNIKKNDVKDRVYVQFFDSDGNASNKLPILPVNYKEFIKFIEKCIDEYSLYGKKTIDEAIIKAIQFVDNRDNLKTKTKDKTMGLKFIDTKKEDAMQVFENELISRKLNRGDSPNPILITFDFLRPVLVQNDDYLDCEYMLEYNGKIYSEEQVNKILEELGVK